MRQSSPYLSAEEANPHCVNGRSKDRSQSTVAAVSWEQLKNLVVWSQGSVMRTARSTIQITLEKKKFWWWWPKDISASFSWSAPPNGKVKEKLKCSETRRHLWTWPRTYWVEGGWRMVTDLPGQRRKCGKRTICLWEARKGSGVRGIWYPRKARVSWEAENRDGLKLCGRSSCMARSLQFHLVACYIFSFPQEAGAYL